MRGNSRWAPFLIRLVLGVIFLKHGWGKVQGMWGALMHDAEWQFVQFVSFMPILPAWLWAFFATAAEFLGGLAVLVGWRVRWGAFFLAVVMVVALTGVHLPTMEGWEKPLALLVMATSLILTGPGHWSMELRR